MPTACQNPIAGNLKSVGINQFHSHMVTAEKSASSVGMKKRAPAAMIANLFPRDISHHLW